MSQFHIERLCIGGLWFSNLGYFQAVCRHQKISDQQLRSWTMSPTCTNSRPNDAMYFLMSMIISLQLIEESLILSYLVLNRMWLLPSKSTEEPNNNSRYKLSTRLVPSKDGHWFSFKSLCNHCLLGANIFLFFIFVFELLLDLFSFYLNLMFSKMAFCFGSLKGVKNTFVLFILSEFWQAGLYKNKGFYYLQKVNYIWQCDVIERLAIGLSRPTPSDWVFDAFRANNFHFS